MRELGTGVLNWDRGERVSDRYGIVHLQTNADPNQDERVPLTVIQECAGKCGRLIALVKETRESYHIGDLHHNVYPTTPQSGTAIVLGTGILFFDAGNSVGLEPTDGRKKLWLDIRSLYRAHHQTVTLCFEEI